MERLQILEEISVEELQDFLSGVRLNPVKLGTLCVKIALDYLEKNNATAENFHELYEAAIREAYSKKKGTRFAVELENRIVKDLEDIEVAILVALRGSNVDYYDAYHFLKICVICKQW